MSCRIQHIVTDRQEGAASTHQEPALNQWAEAEGKQKAQTTVAPGPCHAAQIPVMLPIRPSQLARIRLASLHSEALMESSNVGRKL